MECTATRRVSLCVCVCASLHSVGGMVWDEFLSVGSGRAVPCPAPGRPLGPAYLYLTWH